LHSSCDKCGGFVYRDYIDEDFICINCGKRFYIIPGTLDDRERKPKVTEYDESKKNEVAQLLQSGTVPEASEISGVSKNTIYRWRRSGVIPT
jgi:uncharacterized Zn finger protein (UPF0148 family)